MHFGVFSVDFPEALSLGVRAKNICDRLPRADDSCKCYHRDNFSLSIQT